MTCDNGIKLSQKNQAADSFVSLQISPYEVSRPLSNDMKGGRHINCPFGYVGRGRARVVTHG